MLHIIARFSGDRYYNAFRVYEVSVIPLSASIDKTSLFEFFDELSYLSGHINMVLLWYHFVNNNLWDAALQHIFFERQIRQIAFCEKEWDGDTF